MADTVDLEPSVPRTPTQAVLRIVSIIMAILGALVLLGGIAVIVTTNGLAAAGGDLWTVVTFGGIIVAAAGLLLLTAVLGIAASNNSARVGPYRFLCYLVGLMVLVAIVWGWGLGTFILFNPIVLTTTIVYVLVCSRLADRVKEEHDRGITGETFLRSRHQRVLHLLSGVIVLKGVLSGVVAGVLLVAICSFGVGEEVVISGVPITITEDMVIVLAAIVLVTAVNLLMGGLGIYGSNRPARIRPFIVLSAAILLADLVRVVYAVLSRGPGGVPFDIVLDLFFTGVCLYLARCILRQPSVEAPLEAPPAQA